MAIFDLIENEKGYKIRKGSFSDPNATIEHVVKRVREAKGKNPNIYQHTLIDEAGGKYIVDSKFPGKAKPDEVRTRKFMDRSATIKDAASHVDGEGVTKFETPPDEKAKASIESSNKKMSESHFKETSAESTSNSAVKNSKIGNWLKNSKAGNWLKNTKVGNKIGKAGNKIGKAGNWLKNTKVGGYFTDSPLTPHNVALTPKPHTGGLTIKGWRVGWDPRGPVVYAANAYGMGGYMPIGEHIVDQLRIQHGQDELSNQDTNVPINPQGTMYLDPELGVVDTQVLKDEDGIRYYRNAQTGQFDPLDYGAPFRYSSIPVEQTPFPKSRIFNIGDDANYLTDSDANKPLPHISADQLARNNIAKAKVANFNKTADYLNDIISGVIKNIPQDISKLPLPPVSTDTDEGEIPSGKVVVGPDTEVPTQSVQPVAKSPRKAIKPRVINNTPDTPVVNTPTPTPNVPTPNVAAPTLSSVVPQAVRHNGGFDNYRRQSVLSALRAAGGISPAEAVQRGIIPMEALNYI